MQNEKNNIPGVGVILIYQQKFLLQLRDNKPTISNPNMWGFVGGGIDGDESPMEAIRRECKEEIGIIPENLTYIGHTKDSKFRFYAYLHDDEVTRISLGEGQAVKFFAHQEIKKLNATPRVKTFFQEYNNSVEKFIKKEKVKAEDVGLEV